MIRDALDGLSIKVPIPIGKLGTIFWAESYMSGKGDLSGANSFEEFCKRWDEQEWTRHYATPAYGSFGLVINLNAPLKEDGFDSVRIDVDYLMSTIGTEVSVDGEQSWGKNAHFNKLAIPKELVFCLKELLLEFCGEELFCHYCCLPEEGDPREIFISFVHCQNLNMKADTLLAFIAGKLSQTIVS